MTAKGGDIEPRTTYYKKEEENPEMYEKLRVCCTVEEKRSGRVVWKTKVEQSFRVLQALRLHQTRKIYSI